MLVRLSSGPQPSIKYLPSKEDYRHVLTHDHLRCLDCNSADAGRSRICMYGFNYLDTLPLYEMQRIRSRDRVLRISRLRVHGLCQFRSVWYLLGRVSRWLYRPDAHFEATD